ncbi:uncharacterized protein isoform X2 [Rhodnius prolixus]|uniref:uncharacterized protein isoform X2 n=1 Tax=Rhodnius prolixus TaxID=13249 RepID=UPI003D18F2F1
MIKTAVQAWDSSSRDNRREEVVVSRLRIGHTRLTHGYLMCQDSPPTCGSCNEPLTVQHVLVECSEYEQYRQRHGVPHSLEEALADDQKRIDNGKKK